MKTHPLVTVDRCVDTALVLSSNRDLGENEHPVTQCSQSALALSPSYGVHTPLLQAPVHPRVPALELSFHAVWSCSQHLAVF